MSDREIPDTRELTKIGWSVLKILGIWLLFFLLTKCMAHAQGNFTATYGNSDYMWYSDGVIVTITANWPSSVTLYVADSNGNFSGNVQGGTTFQVTLQLRDGGSYEPPQTSGQDTFTAYTVAGGQALGTLTESYTLTQPWDGQANDYFTDTFSVNVPQ